MTPETTPDATDRDLELDRQAEIVSREFAERTVLNLLTYALCLVYLDWRAVLVLCTVNLLAEAWSHRVARDPHRRRSAQGQQITLACVAAMEAAFTGAAGLVWMVEDQYAKAFAVGMVMATLLHLTTVRSIHLPYGLAGLAAVAFVGGAANLWYWLREDNLAGLAVSSACMLAALSYTLTAMLSNNGVHRAMRQEQARASRADAAKSRFLAVLSHEMRTPLNAVLGLARAVEAEAEIEVERAGEAAERARACRDKLRMLARSARDMDAIMADAADMSAIADGRFALRERPIDLLAELEATLAPFSAQAAEAGLDLVFETARPIQRHLRADPQRLRQCVGNLVNNALKHAGRGRVTVRAETLAGLIEITVSDTGPGVLLEERDQIFEPFRRGSTSGAGSGLGLAIARSLARQMGGDVRLLPVAPGASFRLTLPFVEATAEAVGARPSGAMPDLPGRVALVVDDTATNRMVATMLLRPSGMRVLEAADGAEALDILAAEPVDIVFLDLNMPRMDGIETLARLRAAGGRNAAVPVIAMTANDISGRLVEVESPEDGRPAVDGVLLKPVDVERLAAELSRHFPG